MAKAEMEFLCLDGLEVWEVILHSDCDFSELGAWGVFNWDDKDNESNYINYIFQNWACFLWGVMKTK